MERRQNLSCINPENLSSRDVLELFLHLFGQKPGFVDRGHEMNHKETFCVSTFLFVPTPAIDPDGVEAFVSVVIGSMLTELQIYAQSLKKH